MAEIDGEWPQATCGTEIIRTGTIRLGSPVSYVIFDDIPLELLANRLPDEETMQALFNGFAEQHPFRARLLILKLKAWQQFDRLCGKPWS